MIDAEHVLDNINKLSVNNNNNNNDNITTPLSILTNTIKFDQKITCPPSSNLLPTPNVICNTRTCMFFK